MVETVSRNITRPTPSGQVVAQDLPRRDRKRSARAIRRLARRRVRIFGRRRWILGFSALWLVVVVLSVAFLGAPGDGGTGQATPLSGMVAFALVQVFILGLASGAILLARHRYGHMDCWHVRTVSVLVTLFWRIVVIQTVWLWSVSSPEPVAPARTLLLSPDTAPSPMFAAPPSGTPVPESPPSLPVCGGHVPDLPCTDG